MNRTRNQPTTRQTGQIQKDRRRNQGKRSRYTRGLLDNCGNVNYECLHNVGSWKFIGELQSQPPEQDPSSLTFLPASAIRHVDREATMVPAQENPWNALIGAVDHIGSVQIVGRHCLDSEYKDDAEVE